MLKLLERIAAAFESLVELKRERLKLEAVQVAEANMSTWAALTEQLYKAQSEVYALRIKGGTSTDFTKHIDFLRDMLIPELLTQRRQVSEVIRKLLIEK